MRWFEGDIQYAMDRSKIQNSLVVVLVGDEKHEIAWNDEAICKVAEENKCICLNIKAKSELESQFSKIYPVKYHPTVYFIGNDGKPILVKVGEVSTYELKLCFSRAIIAHQKCDHSEEQKKTCLSQNIESPVSSQESPKVLKYTRIQFRLPDGSHLNNNFPASDPLLCAYLFVSQNLRGIYKDVQLSTLHPSRIFTEEDYSKTFVELNLTPSAVMIVIPKKASLACLDPKDGNILMRIVYGFLMLWQIVISFIFPNRGVEASNLETSENHSQQNIRTTERNGSSARSRKQGRIHRLRTGDEDDEQATWNGNSTQQM